jgi:N-methylhydantoinase A
MSPADQPNTIRIGVDIGGTFTDFVIYHPRPNRLESFKLLSTPDNPAQAVLDGLKKILSSLNDDHLPTRFDMIHGSTVATNALLERKGARTALITTEGFRDILQIGRQNRRSLYDLFDTPPPPLVPSELRFEVRERVDQGGNSLEEINPEQVAALARKVESLNLDSVAVCFLFSFLHPEHEKLIAESLKNSDLFVCLSSDILPEYREFERTSTTVVNAYVSPILTKYLTHLENEVEGQHLHASIKVLQSNGGSISLPEARRNGVRCILSGPAGGLQGAHFVASLAQSDLNTAVKIITFDMGGTSTDVSLMDGAPTTTTESIIGGHPIRVPVLDIHTIGAGGGSIAYVDAGGALRVGPQSAGADPGPACYGRGTLPTVTDANLLLGRLPPENFLGGKMVLDEGRAQAAISALAERLHLDTITTALGIIEVVNANMERALRVISVERGHDPRDFTLLSFGGAGGLHCSSLAKRSGAASVLIPPLASTLSAFGMLASDLIKDYTQTVMLPGDAAQEEIALALKQLAERGLYEVATQGIPEADIVIEQSLDVRYRGQSYELGIPYCEDIHAVFDEAHLRAYGYSRPEAPLEIVNIRVRAIGKTAKPQLVTPPGIRWQKVKKAALCTVHLPEGATLLHVYRGDDLPPGSLFDGPALVVREDTTILAERGDRCRVDRYGNIWMEIITSQQAQNR